MGLGKGYRSNPVGVNGNFRRNPNVEATRIQPRGSMAPPRKTRQRGEPCSKKGTSPGWGWAPKHFGQQGHNWTASGPVVETAPATASQP